MAHTFFLSYARSDADSYFKRFRQELAEAVRVRVSGALEDVAFVDRDDILPGEEWRVELADALRHSKVLVPVYSRSFFSSDYCGREWTVFRQRQDVAVAGGAARRPPVIQPVLWVGWDDLPDSLPGVAGDIQLEHDKYGEEYAQVGLRRMMMQSRYRNARTDVIEGIADMIVDVARVDALPPLPAAPVLSDIPSAFIAAAAPLGVAGIVAPAVVAGVAGVAGIGAAAAPAGRSSTSGPRYVQFIYVAGRRDQLAPLRKQVACYGEDSGEQWKPYHPEVSCGIADLALEVAGTERFYTQPMPLAPDLISRLEEAERQDNLVAIIVDTWTLRLEEYHTFMREYDKRSFLNCVVLVPWNSADEETEGSREVLEDAIRATFPVRSAIRDPKSFIDAIGSSDDLRSSLANSLTAARARVINAADVRRRAESAKVFVKPVISVTREV
jgi:FxsC-like protein